MNNNLIKDTGSKINTYIMLAHFYREIPKTVTRST